MIKKHNTMILNVGPQHPSTHGVLRLEIELDGEIIISCKPIIGYLHRGLEKIAEKKSYIQYLPMVDRVDYLSGFFYSYAFCKAVERIADIEPPYKAKLIRVIMMEFNRISSHLMWLGSLLLDMGATSPLFYAFRERENILALLEEYSGQRMMYNAFIFGGVKFDMPEGWIIKARKLIDIMPKYFDEYEAIITKNPIVTDRMKGIGIISEKDIKEYAVTGANARGSGVDLDYRTRNDKTFYSEFDFSVPIKSEGDCYARYCVRMSEMRESLKIIKQALEKYEKVASQEICTKKITATFKPPKGEASSYTETPRGLCICHIISDGTKNPYRVKFRTGSFASIQLLEKLAINNTLSNLMPIIGSLDFVLPEADR